jgi:hypothetical protein
MFTMRKRGDLVDPQSRRAHPRTLLSLPAQLYLPAEQTAQSCVVTDLSAGGACLTCEDVPPLSAFVILHIQGFGRFEAVTAHFREGVLGVRFIVREARRVRLETQIAAFLNEGVEAAALCGMEGVAR